MKSRSNLSRRYKTPPMAGMEGGRDSAAEGTPGFSPGGAPFLMVLILIFTLPKLVIAQEAVTSAFPRIDFKTLRKEMVRTQIEARGIKDKAVLEAMQKVERHRFVPPEVWHLAYEDGPLPIGSGQTISQPYIVALMTELLQLKDEEKVLEIGTGSGYQAAILAELVKEVYTIEILPELASRAEKLLKDLGYQNIKVKCGDGYLGWPKFAPFDGIMVTCAPEEIPDALIEQLAEGGRLVIPVGKYFQSLKLLIKKEGKIIEKDIIPVRFVPMLKGR